MIAGTQNYIHNPYQFDGEDKERIFEGLSVQDDRQYLREHAPWHGPDRDALAAQLEHWRESAGSTRFLWMRFLYPPSLPLGMGLLYQIRQFSEPVESLAMIPAHVAFAAASYKQIGVWRLLDGLLVDQVESMLHRADHIAISRDLGHLVRGRHAVFSPNGTLLATTTDRIAVHTFDDTMKISVAGETWIAQSPKDRGEASDYWRLYSDMIWIWDIEKRACVSVINKRESDYRMYAKMVGNEGDDSVRALSWSPSGSQVAYTSTRDRLIRICSVHAPGKVFDIDPETVADSLCYDPSGEYIAAGSYEGDVLLLSATSGRVAFRRKEHRHSSRVLSLHFSEDGTHLLSAGADGQAILWRVPPLEKQAVFPHDEQLNAAIFSLYLRRVVTASGRDVGGPDGNRVNAISVWSLNASHAQVELTTPSVGASLSNDRPIRLSAHGRFLGCIGGYYRCRVVETTSGKVWIELGGHSTNVSCICFDDDDELVATGGGHRDYLVRIWDLQNKDLVHKLKGPDEQVLAIAFSPHRKLVAAGFGHPFSDSKDNRIRVWELDSGRVHADYTAHTGPVRSVAFSPDGLLLASGSDDKTARVWNMRSQTEVMRHDHTHRVSSVVFDDSSKQLFTGSWQILRCVDIASGSVIRHWDGLSHFQHLQVRRGRHEVELLSINAYRRMCLKTGREVSSILNKSHKTELFLEGVLAVSWSLPLEHVQWSADANVVAGASGGHVIIGRIHEGSR